MNGNNSIAGITLVALIVTIVVLLILAGITIMYVFGDNSVFKKASDAKVKTEIGKIEERAQMIYSDKLLENAGNSLNTKVETSQVIEQLKSEGYEIKQRVTSADDITGISLDKENMTIGKNKTAEIKVTYEGAEEPFIYYVELNEKYYQIYSNKGFITVDREPSDLTKSDFEVEEGNGESTTTLIVTSSDESIVTAKLKEESSNTIEVTSLDKEGTITIVAKYGTFESKPCTITVKEIPIATELEMKSIRARVALGYIRWLSAITTPEDASQELEWSSSDTSIATVDSKGIVTTKKAGEAVITAKTTDGSNKEGKCTVTVVENAADVATLTEVQKDGDKVARDKNGNILKIPQGFRVLANGTSNADIATVEYNFDNTNHSPTVQDGIVIADNEDNQFVWVPIDSISMGVSKPADDIRLGRYASWGENAKPVQTETNYSEDVNIKGNNNWDFQESVNQTGANSHAKDLKSFIDNAITDGGYWFGRYEASNDSGAKSKYDKVAWTDITQSNAATAAQNMKSSGIYQSDLVNSYAWDTTVMFIERYGNTGYASQTSKNASKLNTGRSEDKACNLFDVASNCEEWCTETCPSLDYPASGRGNSYLNRSWGTIHRGYSPIGGSYPNVSFRCILFRT